MMADQIVWPKGQHLASELPEWARSQETEIARALAAKWALDMLAKATSELAVVRTEAVRGLWSMGWSLKEISEALGLSRARIHQIIEK